MRVTTRLTSSSSSVVVVVVVISVIFPFASSHDGGGIALMLRRRHHRATTSALPAFVVVVENRRRRTTGVDAGLGRTMMGGAADGRTTRSTRTMMHSISSTATSSSPSSSSSSPPPTIVDVIDTLDDVSHEYGYLFPRTANCIRALSSSTSTSSMSMEARPLPSVEEFLDGLSSEFHLATSSSPPPFHPPSSSSLPPSSSYSTFEDGEIDASAWRYDDVHHLVGSMAPFLASSMAAIAAAAAAAGAASNEGGPTAIVTGSSSSMPRPSGSTSDSIVDRLEDVFNLPHHHIVMPTMTNSFPTEASPSSSIRSALSSFRAAVGPSEEGPGGVLDAISRSFDDVSEGIADASKSFEGLLGRMTAVGGEAVVAASSDRPPSISDVVDFQSVASPSMQGALSSIKAAAGASVGGLGGVLDAIVRSFDDMSDGMSDDGVAVPSKSLEGLSGRITAVGGEAASLDRSPSIAEVADELSDSLHSRQLSGLDRDGLQHLQHGGDAASTGGLAAIDPGTSPIPHVGGSTSDSIMARLDRLNFPHYHLELPTMTNPFSSEASPSMQGALSSIRAAVGASEETLGGVLDAFARSYEDLSGGVVDASNSFEGLSGRISEVGDAGATGVKALVNSLQGGAAKVAAFRPNMEASPPNLNIVDGVAQFRPPEFNVEMKLPNLDVIDGTSAVRRIGDASLSDFGNAVLYTVKFTGGIVINFLDFILNAVSGTSLASILANVQYSVTTAIDDASHTVIGTLTNIGNMSVIEVIQRIMKLVIVIADIFLKIMNAILYVISGKDGAAWAIQATTSIDRASTQLLAKASSAFADLTHTSLTELAHSIRDYGQLVGDEFVTLIASVSSSVDGVSLAGLSLPDDLSDSVASALQTVFSL